ncbi:MAG: hypothetical protein R3D67_11265 [Hyphomicrobiaceae bacterium]
MTIHHAHPALQKGQPRHYRHDFCYPLWQSSASVGLAIDGARSSGTSTRIAAATPMRGPCCRQKTERGRHQRRAEVRQTALNYFQANMDAMGGSYRYPLRRHSRPTKFQRDHKCGNPAFLTSPQVLVRPLNSTSLRRSFSDEEGQLSLVLDTTGSWPAQKLPISAAAINVIDTIFATNPLVGQIRVAIVPYSTSVNLGPTPHSPATA